MQHRRPDLAREIAERRRQIYQHDNQLVRRDLGRMLSHAEQIWNELDRELVESRRRGSYTTRYLERETELEQHLRTIGRYLVYAHLRFD